MSCNGKSALLFFLDKERITFGVISLAKTQEREDQYWRKEKNYPCALGELHYGKDHDNHKCQTSGEAIDGKFQLPITFAVIEIVFGHS